jgi:hypothetical protein
VKSSTSQSTEEISQFFRQVVVYSSVPGSRRSRPVAWWVPVVSEAIGRPVTPEEVRRALERVPGVRFRGEGTNIAAGQTLLRARLMFPGKFLRPVSEVKKGGGAR